MDLIYETDSYSAEGYQKKSKLAIRCPSETPGIYKSSNVI